MEAAVNYLGMRPLIEHFPKGLEHRLQEQGKGLSTGEMQLIALARAIIHPYSLLILDEATSSLDSITEQQIQQSINLILEQNSATVIAIAHRLSTIRHMDRIVVLDEGKIIEEGTFNQLMSNQNGYFKTLWDAQVNGMVL